MIFGRKKRQAEPTEAGRQTVDPAAAGNPTEDVEVATTRDVTEGRADDGAETELAQNTVAAGTVEGPAVPGAQQADGTDDATAGAAGVAAPEDPDVVDEEVDVDALDAQDWRTEGPWDETEVEPERLTTGEDLPRIDLGSLLLTGVEGMELQLQVAEDTQQIVSAMMVLAERVTVDGEVHELNSALEVAAFAAPRSPGFWSEIREEILEGAQESGGSAGLTAGPFGVEVRRMMLLETPEGEQGYQPSRMWVVEGPRWILRGVVYGHGALDGVPGDHVDHIAEVFRQIVVRRGDDPMAPGDLLPLRLPENMVEEPNEE